MNSLDHTQRYQVLKIHLEFHLQLGKIAFRWFKGNKKGKHCGHVSDLPKVWEQCIVNMKEKTL